MKSGVLLSVFALSLVLVLPSSFAAEPSPADQMAAAVESWRIGDLATAQVQLTQMIDAGTRDPRAYYFRGLISEQLGADADLDLKAGAKLEAETTATRLVNRALEYVQGPTRAKIEKYRGVEQILRTAVIYPFGKGCLPFLPGQTPLGIARHDTAVTQRETAVAQCHVDAQRDRQQALTHRICCLAIGHAENDAVVLIGIEGLLQPAL